MRAQDLKVENRLAIDQILKCKKSLMRVWIEHSIIGS